MVYCWDDIRYSGVRYCAHLRPVVNVIVRAALAVAPPGTSPARPPRLLLGPNVRSGVAGIYCRRVRTPGVNQHGGQRKSAGRKRNVLPPEVLAHVGAPPTTRPLQLVRWYSALLAEFVNLFVRTGKYVEMLREVKGAAGAMGRVMPMDVLLAAMRKLKDDEDDLDEDADADEEVREVDGASSRAVRRDAP